MSEEKKSFWSSLPGVLSGLAALIGAAATFYVAVLKDDKPAEARTAAPIEHEQAAAPVRTESSLASAPLEPLSQQQSSSLQSSQQSSQQSAQALIEPAAMVAEPVRQTAVRSEPVTHTSTLGDQLIGIWYVESGGPTPAGRFQFRGTTEYFRNGSLSTVMEVTIAERMPTGNEVAITYDAVASGEWQIHGRELLEKTVSLKSVPKYLHVDGIRSPINQLDYAMQEELPKLEDMLPIGHSSSSEILNLQRDQIQIRTRDANGNLSIVEGSRWDRHFVPSP